MNDLERKAWESRTSSERHKPIMAAKAAVDQIERGELPNIKHLVIVAIEDVDGSDRVHILQVGDLSELAVEGALHRAINLQSQA